MATGRIGTTPVLTVRWSKAPAAGTTNLSGLDDNSVSLVYSVGYEQVYRNGTLLSRGNDYTATNGTSITLIDATLAGDIVEVIANATIALTDTYTQSVANGKFINNTLTTTTGDIIYASAANTPARLGIGSAGQVLTVSSGVPAWTTPTFVGCALYKSATQTCNNGANTVLTWENEYLDTDAFHSTSSNTSRITVPSGKAGKYLVAAQTNYTADTTALQNLTIIKNGSMIVTNVYGNSRWFSRSMAVSTVVDLAATDYIEVQVTVSGGSNLTTEQYATWCYAYLIGA